MSGNESQFWLIDDRNSDKPLRFLKFVFLPVISHENSTTLESTKNCFSGIDVLIMATIYNFTTTIQKMKKLLCNFFIRKFEAEKKFDAIYRD